MIREKVLQALRRFVPEFLKNWYHFFLSLISAVFYGFPSRKLKVIGVTGTNGKTTTVELTEKIFEGAGYKIASVSSIKFKIGEKVKENLLRITMPGRFFLQRFLKRALNTGCKYVILEVTSEGIKQHRQRFIDFDVTAFINLTPEHIESHGSFKDYKKAKGRLFEQSKKVSVVNLDDPYANYFLKFPAAKKYGYKIESKTQNPKVKNLKIIEVKNCKVAHKGISFNVEGIDFNLKLLGSFNIYNALAAISIAASQGIDLKTCKRALEKVEGMPGRMEIVIDKPFKVIVDYAFTPNALKQVYKTIQRDFLPKKMICVFGACGGGRDKWKRPVLGKIAATFCNEIILTNEDPYDEDPMGIIEQIASGVENISKNQPKSTLYKIQDRREAINKALSFAKPEDIIVITGKGCEPSICLAGGKEIVWDDRKVVREEFKKVAKDL